MVIWWFFFNQIVGTFTQLRLQFANNLDAQNKYEFRAQQNSIYVACCIAHLMLTIPDCLVKSISLWRILNIVYVLLEFS